MSKIKAKSAGFNTCRLYSFTLCAEKEPKAPSTMGYVYPEVLLIGAAVLMAVVVVIVFARAAKKKRMK